MNYDPYFNSYTTTVRMKEGAQFKFVVEGNYQVSFDYPIIYDAQGFQNNVFQLNHANQNKLSRVPRIHIERRGDEKMTVVPLLANNLRVFEQLHQREDSPYNQSTARMAKKKQDEKSDTTTDQECQQNALSLFTSQSKEPGELDDTMLAKKLHDSARFVSFSVAPSMLLIFYA